MKGKEAGLFDNKALASLIHPLLVEQFLAVLVGMADSIMVASVGEAAVSGVSLVDNVMVLFINLFAALATGGAVIAGQYLGQEDRRSSGKAATQSDLVYDGCVVRDHGADLSWEKFHFASDIWRYRGRCLCTCKYISVDCSGIGSISCNL